MLSSSQVHSSRALKPEGPRPLSSSKTVKFKLNSTLAKLRLGSKAYSLRHKNKVPNSRPKERVWTSGSQRFEHLSTFEPGGCTTLDSSSNARKECWKAGEVALLDNFDRLGPGRERS